MESSAPQSEDRMIRYIAIGFVLAHLVWSLAVTGWLWWMSRDPKPRTVLPFKRVVR